MRARIKDIAAALDLSVSTVQSILRNNAGFREETRRRVLEKARELKYRPNLLARSLVTQSTHVLGLVIPDLSLTIFPRMLQGVDEVAHSLGYQLLVCSSADDVAREDEETAALIGKQVDGLLVASAHARDDRSLWPTVADCGIPFVLVDRYHPGKPFVGTDDEHVGFIATRHLVEQGYNEISFLGVRARATGNARWQGYLRALRDSRLPIRKAYAADVYGVTAGYEATIRLLRERRCPNAVVATSESTAMGAMRAAQDAGLLVPTDFGVIGVGNSDLSDYLHIRLSVVDVHPVEVGKSATSILLEMIGGKPAPRKPIFIEPTLIARDSTNRGTKLRAQQAGFTCLQNL